MVTNIKICKKKYSIRKNLIPCDVGSGVCVCHKLWSAYHAALHIGLCGNVYPDDKCEAHNPFGKLDAGGCKERWDPTQKCFSCKSLDSNVWFFISGVDSAYLSVSLHAHTIIKIHIHTLDYDKITDKRLMSLNLFFPFAFLINAHSSLMPCRALWCWSNILRVSGESLFWRSDWICFNVALWVRENNTPQHANAFLTIDKCT